MSAKKAKDELGHARQDPPQGVLCLALGQLLCLFLLAGVLCATMLAYPTLEPQSVPSHFEHDMETRMAAGGRTMKQLQAEVAQLQLIRDNDPNTKHTESYGSQGP